MDTILALLMFAMLLGSLWDIRRSQAVAQASLERIDAAAQRIEESAERIAQLTAEVLRRSN